MKSYLERQNECGIKVGDKVKVVRKAENHEDGWGNMWIPLMDPAVGNEYEVIGVHGISGITINFYLGLTFPYFVLSKVVEKSEPSPQPTDDDFKGYDEEFMDATLRDSIKLLRDTLDYAKLNSQPPKPASGYTATLTFDLTTEDGAEAWRMHNQVRELHSFAFEVLYNLSNNFERDLEYAIEHNDDSDPVQMLRNLIAELSDNYNLNVN